VVRSRGAHRDGYSEDYKIKLREYFQSDGLKRTVIGMLFERQTMAIHDILHLVIRNSRNNRISYDELAALTGLSKSTIGDTLPS